MNWYRNFDSLPAMALVPSKSKPMEALAEKLRARRAPVLTPKLGERIDLLSPGK